MLATTIVALFAILFTAPAVGDLGVAIVIRPRWVLLPMWWSQNRGQY
jgi:hypothetical protein